MTAATLFSAAGLTLFSILSEIFFLRHRAAGSHRLSLLLKGLASLCFCSVGLLLSAAVPVPGACAVCLGLAMGLLGDVLLGLRKLFPGHHDLTFLLGAVAFSLGHGFYMLALTRTASLPLLPVLLLFGGLMAGTEVFARQSRFRQSRMHLPGLLYIGIEALMASLALVLPWVHRRPGAVLFALGGLSFFISDNLLCGSSFGNLRSPRYDTALHITYLGAQLLIAWSIPLL